LREERLKIRGKLDDGATPEPSRCRDGMTRAAGGWTVGNRIVLKIYLY